MPIIRQSFEKKFTIIPNSLLLDSTLSWEAKTVMICFLSSSGEGEETELGDLNQFLRRCGLDYLADEDRLEWCIRELKEKHYIS